MSALSLHTYGIGRPMTAAEQQSTGALLLIGAACAIALAVAAVMVGLEWWAERRGRHRFVLLADDMPVVVPASVRVWTEDMEGSSTGCWRSGPRTAQRATGEELHRSLVDGEQMES
jgi:hypothetical protein